MIAVVGSFLYGASLSLVLEWSAVGGALWLAISAGAGWCVFIPALIAITKLRGVSCVHASLVTMAYGEGILTLGALLNVALWWAAAPIDAALLNYGTIALSNLVMAATLAAQLQAIGGRIWTVLLTFFLVLDGAGAVIFWVTFRAFSNLK